MNEMNPVSGGSEVCLPSSALAIGGEDNGQTLPEVGDEVNFEAGGTVTRVEGDMVYVSMNSANGEPIEPSGAPKEDSLEQFESELEEQPL